MFYSKKKLKILLDLIFFTLFLNHTISHKSFTLLFHSYQRNKMMIIILTLIVDEDENIYLEFLQLIFINI